MLSKSFLNSRWMQLNSSNLPKEGKQTKAKLDPATRMNSCNEFRQGTNIMMQAERGI